MEALFIRTRDGIEWTDAGRADIRQALAEYLSSCEIPEAEWPGIIEAAIGRGGSSLDVEQEAQRWLSEHGRVLASPTLPYVSDETLTRVAKRFRRKAIGDDRVNAHLDRLDQRDAAHPAPAQPKTNEPTATPTASDVVKGRSVTLRNRWFLTQHSALGTDTFHSPKAIREKWNRMTESERATICPSSPGKVTKDTVAQAIKLASKPPGK
jgi:hypothetical protein